MATITGAAGGWPWEPNPALKAALQGLAAQRQRAIIQPWVNASLAPQRQRWADVARQASGLSEAAKRASEVAKAISAGRAQFEVWRQHQEQIAETIRLMQGQRSLQMGFSAQTFDRATELLEQLRSAPPEATAATEAAVLEIPDAVLEIPEAVVPEIVEATEPAVRADPAKERRIVIAVVATLVFLNIIQWAIEHPETAGELLTAWTLAWCSASAAGGQAGRLWDKFVAAKPTDPDADHDSDD
jgi:hypothetical protein